MKYDYDHLEYRHPSNLSKASYVLKIEHPKKWCGQEPCAVYQELACDDVFVSEDKSRYLVAIERRDNSEEKSVQHNASQDVAPRHAKLRKSSLLDELCEKRKAKRKKRDENKNHQRRDRQIVGPVSRRLLADEV